MATPNTTPPPVQDPQVPPVPPAPQAQQRQEDPETLRLRGEVAKHQRELAELKARLTAPAAPAVNTDPAEAARNFYRDPITSAEAIAQRVVQQTLDQQNAPQYDTLVRVARETVRGSSDENRRIFDKYIVEIEQAVQSVSPQFRTNINVWENAFKLVKGNHIDEIIAERAAAQQPPPAQPQAPAVHISSGSGPALPNNRPGQASRSEDLTPDEKRTARKLGLSEDQYKTGKTHYQGQNDPQVDPVGKSSWDEHITFNSAEARRKARVANRR